MGLLPNRLCDENSKFRAKILKCDDAYLAKIRGGAVCNLQPKFRICSRSLFGNSPFIWFAATEQLLFNSVMPIRHLNYAVFLIKLNRVCCQIRFRNEK